MTPTLSIINHVTWLAAVAGAAVLEGGRERLLQGIIVYCLAHLSAITRRPPEEKMAA